jgi:uncharacterized protein YjiS (DUF1127 family)
VSIGTILARRGDDGALPRNLKPEEIEMTAIAFTAEPTVSPASRIAHFATEAFALVRNVWAAHRARQARRIALLTLMQFEPHRLDDIGVSLDDVADALRGAR